MVRSRSQTNLNRIFLDLCTSPSIRSKHLHDQKGQNQQSSTLPRLHAIKSNSCSDLNSLENSMCPLSSNNNETEQMHRSDLPARLHLEPLGPRLAMENSHETSNTNITAHSIPLCASTGFRLQSSTNSGNYSLPSRTPRRVTSSGKLHDPKPPCYNKSISFEPDSLNNKKKTTRNQNHLVVDDDAHEDTNPELFRESTSDNRKHSDTGCRLFDRFTARKYLRKIFM